MNKKLNILVDSYFNNDYLIFLNRLKRDINVYYMKDMIDNKSETYKKASSIDLLVFTGGSDVSPALYGEKTGKHTLIDTDRDTLERSIYQMFRHTPKLGICRGAQLLTVLNRGKLIQHVNGHNTEHDIHVRLHEIDRIYTCKATSSHHQMMLPTKRSSPYKIVGWSKRYLSTTYLNGDNSEIELKDKFKEPEIIIYKEKELCIQGHPEYTDACTPYKQVCTDLLYNILN